MRKCKIIVDRKKKGVYIIVKRCGYATERSKKKW